MTTSRSNLLKVIVMVCAIVVVIRLLTHHRKNSVITVAVNIDVQKSPGLESLNEIMEPTVGFSVFAPTGWEVKTFPHSRFPTICAPITDGITPNCDIETESFAGSLDEYVGANMNSVQATSNSLVVVSQGEFKTTSGEMGFRVMVHDIKFRDNLSQIYYFFKLHKDNQFLLLVATSTQGSESTIDSCFDALVKTLVLSYDRASSDLPVKK